MVDRGRAARYLETLELLLADWGKLAAESSAARLASDRAFAQRVCYVVMASIQCAIDLANLVIAEERLPRPESYRESFARVARAGIIKGRGTAAVLQELAGFRNVLVHHYIDLDWSRVQRNLRRGRAALAAFRKSIARRAR
jgi:uncharacterized protein YutE (UPF0331/DUF86 family)